VILPFLLLRPFRCEDCTKRHYNLFFTRALHEPDQKHAGARRSGTRRPQAETRNEDETA